MAAVLAFGDSLTWGRAPEGAWRHAAEDQWPVALAAGLADVDVVAEGLRGRLTAFDQTASPADANGARVLPTLLHSHAPLDLVIVMLGSNDIYFGMPPWRAGDGLRRIVELIRGHAWRVDGMVTPDILLVAPPPMVSGPDPVIDTRTIRKSHELVETIRTLAAELDCSFFAAGTVAAASPVDGIHMDAANTRALGVALRDTVTKILATRAASA